MLGVVVANIFTVNDTTACACRFVYCASASVLDKHVKDLPTTAGKRATFSGVFQESSCRLLGVQRDSSQDVRSWSRAALPASRGDAGQRNTGRSNLRLGIS